MKSNLTKHLFAIMVWALVVFGSGSFDISAQNAQTGEGAIYAEQERNHAQRRMDPRIALPSDTGRMIRGHIDFRRYTEPGECEQVVYTMRDHIWRTIDQDTVTYVAALRDTLPSAAVEAGRLCAASFHAETIPARELRNLSQLALAIGADSLARAAIQRRLALATTAADRSEILLQSFEDYTTAKPVRLADAQAVIQRLDSIGREAKGPRLRVREWLLMHQMELFDQVNLPQTIESTIDIVRELTPAERDLFFAWRPLGLAYAAKCMLLLYDNPAGIADQIIQMEQELHALRGPSNQYKNALELVMALSLHVSFVGQPAPQLHSGLWYPEGRPHIWPTPGRVSLLVVVDQNETWSGRRDTDYKLYATLCRLHDRYHTAGLDITLLMPSVGYTRWSSSPPQTVTEEAESARRYFFDLIKLPFSLVVQETPYTRKPDGRRVNGTTDFHTKYPLARVVLVNRHGEVEFIRTGLVFEHEVEAFIKRSLR